MLFTALMTSDRLLGENESAMVPQRRKFHGIEDWREHSFVNPTNDRDANGVPEAIQRLNHVRGQRVIAGSLKSRILSRRHPPHAQLSTADGNHNLLCAAAARRPQTAGDAVGSYFCPLLTLSHATKNRGDKFLLRSK